MQGHTAPRIRFPAPSLRRRLASVPARLPGSNASLEVLAILLIVGWLLGVLSGYTGGRSVHLLLLLAAAAIALRLANPRSE